MPEFQQTTCRNCVGSGKVGYTDEQGIAIAQCPYCLGSGTTTTSVICGNCGVHRIVLEHGIVEQCSWCKDDEYDLYDDRQVP